MAASGEETLEGQLSQVATCPLCLDFFMQPMTLSCGHNLCRDCLAQLAQLGPEPSCTQCRAKVQPSSAYPNRALAKLVGLVKRLRLSEGAKEESSGQRLCQEHGQPLQSFCSREKSLLCLGCLEGHQGHPLLTLLEAAQEYKDLLHGLLKPLRKEEQKLLEQRQAEEQRRHQCQKLFATEKQQVVQALASLQDLLWERQPVWLGWLAEKEGKMEAEFAVPLAQLSGEASRLQQLMAQMQRKCRQPDGEFLQDIQDTVNRCQSYVVGRVESTSPRMQRRFQILLEKNASIKQIVESSKASLQATLTRENLDQLVITAPAPQQPRTPKVPITLNGSTAHPQLLCQGSMVTCTNEYQYYPDVPERFDRQFCILGSEGFTTGLHCWEVFLHEPNTFLFLMGGSACWGIGVAKESVRRKGTFQLSPQEGIWAVGKDFWGEIVTFETYRQKLSFQKPLRRLKVRLDCEVGKVELLDAEREISLYTFWTGPLLGETFRPFFYLGQDGVTLICEVCPCPIKDLQD